MNKMIVSVVTMVVALLFCVSSSAQDTSYDVFNPISKYLAKGDADRLSAWFSDNLEITIFSTTNDSSRSQARQIMKSFFRSYVPRSFEINHKAGSTNMKYALGTLSAGGEMLAVTIFVNFNGTHYRIQHLKVERTD